MKNKINSKKYFGLALLMAFALVAVPSVSFAATYAYVNQSGDVATVVANDGYAAINAAPNRSLHSGVILLKTASDYTDIGM